jgi:predicted nucleic acid-binding protein
VRRVFDTNVLVAEAASEICGETEAIAPVCRDADDDAILACARTVKADFVVTGDGDLLVLERYGATRILTPRDSESLFGD